MKNRDIVIGIIVLLVIAGIIFFVRKPETPEPTPVPTEVEEQLEESFNYELPEDADRAFLKGALLGAAVTGIITRDKTEAETTTEPEAETTNYTVLVDLPDPEEGSFYQAWLVKGEGEDEEYVKIGNLRIAKGGYLLEHETSEDLDQYSKAVITIETKDDDTPEEVVLEGEF